MDSLSRHEQLLRIFHLIDILFGARQPLSTADLKDRLRDRGIIDDMSDKNLRRDVEFLTKFGYAVKQTKKRSDRGGFCQAWEIEACRGAAELKAPLLSLPELLSLAVAREFLAPLAGTVYWRGIGQLLAKLERVATPQLLDYVAENRDGLVVHPRPTPGRYQYRSRMLNAVNRAIRRGLELDIRYTALGHDRPRRAVVRPEALVVYDGAIYIAAYRAPRHPPRGPRAEADVIRFFKLDRVQDVRVSNRSFTRRPETVESLLADSITIFRSADPPRPYRVRIDAARARWARERPFHPRQKIRSLADGAVMLEIDRAWDDEMIPQLLGLGEHVEVIEPADVRDRLADIAFRLAARHGHPAGATTAGHPGGGRRRTPASPSAAG
jgi:predicted DNA-binding transcriptional regulator YafY